MNWSSVMVNTEKSLLHGPQPDVRTRPQPKGRSQLIFLRGHKMLYRTVGTENNLIQQL